MNEITGLIDLGYHVHVISLAPPIMRIPHKHISKYSLLGKTTYVQATRASLSTLFLKSLSHLKGNSVATIREKLYLLSTCYNHQPGRIGLKPALRRFCSCLEILPVIKYRRIDHIHCHFTRQNVHIASVLNKVFHIPYTFTSHAGDIFVAPDKNLKGWAEQAKRVITISRFNTHYMHTQFGIPLEKIVVVPYSKYLDQLTPVQEYSGNPFRIVSVSRLVEKKGYPYLIRACKILKDKGTAFSCIIHGDGEEKTLLERLIQDNKLEHDVLLKGGLAHDEVIRFMKTGSVFVLPCVRAKNNDMDGLPNVLLESMAMAIPTISTRLVGIPELIEDGVNGFLVPPNNASALAEALIRVKENPEFAEQIRQKGRERVLKEFDVHNNVNILVRIWNYRD